MDGYSLSKNVKSYFSDDGILKIHFFEQGLPNIFRS